MKRTWNCSSSFLLGMNDWMKLCISHLIALLEGTLIRPTFATLKQLHVLKIKIERTVIFKKIKKNQPFCFKGKEEKNILCYYWNNSKNSWGGALGIPTWLYTKATIKTSSLTQLFEINISFLVIPFFFSLNLLLSFQH